MNVSDHFGHIWFGQNAPKSVVAFREVDNFQAVNGRLTPSKFPTSETPGSWGRRQGLLCPSWISIHLDLFWFDRKLICVKQVVNLFYNSCMYIT